MSEHSAEQDGIGVDRFAVALLDMRTHTHGREAWVTFDGAVRAAHAALPRQAVELWAEAEHCWTGSGCIHDDEAGCADAFWRLAKRLKSEAFRLSTPPESPTQDTL